MYITGIDPTQVHDEPKFALGSIGATHDGKVWKYVQYKEGTAETAGVALEVAAYLATTGYKDNQVTSDYSDTDNLGAGVLPVGVADDQYLWIQIKGPATLSIELTAGADGNPLTVEGAGDGTLDVAVDSGDAAVPQHICAYAVDADEEEIICDFPF